MDSWEDKATGQKRSKLKVVADNIQLMGAPGGGSGGGGQQNQGASAASGQGGSPAQESAPQDDGDDIPF
jgi:single-strand DNA-binding protein